VKRTRTRSVRSRACDQRTVGKIRDAQGDIDVLLDQVHESINEQQPQADVGVSRQKLEQHGLQMKTPEADRSRHAQLAARAAVVAADRLLDVFQVLQYPSARGEISLALLGEDDAACRAVQETDAEQRLEIGHAATDRRERNAEFAGGGREARVVGDGDEGGHGVESVHDYLYL
jgi:hypothetical protein